MGEGVFIYTLFAALPAKAGIQIFVSKRCVEVWVPAFAGNAGWVGKQDPLLPFGGSTGVAGVGGFIYRSVRRLCRKSGRGGAVLPI